MKFKLSDFVEINPKETLPKYTLAKKIAMEKLQPFCREVSGYDLEKFSGGSKFRNGDTIMARITPCLENGKIAQINILDKEEVGFGSTEFLVFRAKKGFSDPNFIYYLIISELVRIPAIKSMVGSSGRQRVQTSVLENLEIDLPDLETQKKIAKVLSALDDKIELNNQINKNLEEQAQALYRCYFPYCIGDDLPEGWREGSIDEIIEIHDSRRIPLSNNVRQKMINKVYPYYGAASLMDYVDNYIFDGKYLLLGEDGTVIDDKGYAILQYVWGKFWVNNHAHILTGKNGYNVESLYMLFKHITVKSIVTGAVQPKISQANLRSIRIVIPPTNILTEYNSRIESLFALIRSNEDENKSLSSLRDTLLPKLMSGEIDVDNVEI